MTNATKMAKKFGEMINWDGSAWTQPKEADYEKLGAEFMALYPDVLANIMPNGFDSVEEYVEHIKASGRSIEFHVASKMVACYW